MKPNFKLSMHATSSNKNPFDFKMEDESTYSKATSCSIYWITGPLVPAPWGPGSSAMFFVAFDVSLRLEPLGFMVCTSGHLDKDSWIAYSNACNAHEMQKEPPVIHSVSHQEAFARLWHTAMIQKSNEYPIKYKSPVSATFMDVSGFKPPSGLSTSGLSNMPVTNQIKVSKTATGIEWSSSFTTKYNPELHSIVMGNTSEY